MTWRDVQTFWKYASLLVFFAFVTDVAECFVNWIMKLWDRKHSNKQTNKQTKNVFTLSLPFEYHRTRIKPRSESNDYNYTLFLLNCSLTLPHGSPPRTSRLDWKRYGEWSMLINRRRAKYSIERTCSVPL